MKNKINIENYEAYLLDLAEGQLSHAEESELVRFLSKHPELNVDLDSLAYLTDVDSDETLSFSLKNELLKDESSGLSKKEHLMISSIEDEISDEEKLELDELIAADSEILKDLSYYQKTKLVAEKVVFPNKEKLKKKETKLIPFWTYAAAVAAAILALFLFNMPLDSSYSPRETKFSFQPADDVQPTFAFVIKEELYQDEGKEKVENTPLKKVEKEALPNNQFAQQEKEKQPASKIEEQAIDLEEEQLANMEPQSFDLNLEEEKKEILPVEADEIAELNQEPEAIAAVAADDLSANEASKVYTPVEYARKLIKEDVLKNRTIAESLMDELASITNDKVNLEKKTPAESNQQFALNIGKLRISKK